MDVFLLWHVHHAGPDHRDSDGELSWDEADGDDVKILGVYSSEERARERIARARKLPGFSDEPECFLIAASVVDDDQWTEGFLTVPQ